MLVWVLDVPLLTQLIVTAPEEAVEYGQGAWASAPWMESQVPDFGLTQQQGVVAIWELN